MIDRRGEKLAFILLKSKRPDAESARVMDTSFIGYLVIARDRSMTQIMMIDSNHRAVFYDAVIWAVVKCIKRQINGQI